MLLKYFYDETLAQASYMVGCAKTGEALVIDPMRNIEPYLQTAAKEGLRITQVSETHIHADFASGLRELAARTGATMYVSDMGDADWKYAFAGEPNVIPLRDGDNWKVGNIKVDVIHTPGHTPEHISFMITDTAAANKPIGVFTGDFIFVGDVGRPDLLEEAAGLTGTKEPGARKQFSSVQKFKALPDYLQIWPGHGAGSACGKALGAIPSTTLGYEKLFNPAFQFDAEDAFVRWLLSGQPEAPRYFAQMKKINKQGWSLLGTLPEPKQMDHAALMVLVEAGQLVIDLRSREDYARAGISGTINVPMTDNSFLTYIGWFADYNKPLFFVTPSKGKVEPALTALRSIGIDNTPAYFAPEAAREDGEALPTMSASQLAERLPRNGLIIVDVRGKTEYDEKHIAGAKHIPLGHLPRRMSELPKDHTLIMQCASGYRSQIAASYLRAHGFKDVATLNDDVQAWSKALPTEPRAS
jgi:hydroxyacylglutathione hydrolase